MVCTKVPARKRKRKLLALGAFLSFGALSLSLFGGSALAKAAVEVRADDPAEELVASDRISIAINSSASTSTAHSFSCTATSPKIETVSNKTALSNVFVTVDDGQDGWNGIYNTKVALAEEKEKAAAEGKEWVAPHFTATVFRIQNSKTNHNIVIPSTLFYAETYYLDVVSIASEVCKDATGDEISYKNIENVYIPSTIENIAENAFVGAKEAGVAIDLQVAELKPGYEANWTDAEYRLGIEPSASQSSNLNQNASGVIKYFGEGETFLIGYTGSPLEVRYNVIGDDGKVIKKASQQLPLNTKPTTLNPEPYDAVGSLAGKDSMAIDIDIPLKSGEHVDPTSLSFHNIRKAKQVQVEIAGKTTNTLVPDPETPVYWAHPHLRYAANVKFSDIFHSSVGRISSVGGYTMVTLNLVRRPECYATVMPSGYKQYRSMIEDGTLVVRHQFTSLNDAFYRITYEGANGLVTKDVKVSTPISNFVIETTGNYEAGFLFLDSDVGPDFSPSRIKEFDLCHFLVKIDLMNVEKNSLLNKSGVSILFSSLVVAEAETAAAPYTDMNVVTIIVALATVAIYVGLSVAYYFYAKEKFKNDEFRRINKKKYVKAAAKNGLGVAIVVAAIYSIVLRWGVFRSSIVTFNPLDVFVIVFTIAALIYIGFTIKNFVIAFKNSRKRKEAARLHLDEDEEDDGTK